MNADSSKPCVIFNPTARGERALQFQRQLREIEHRAVLQPTACAGDARHLARRAIEAGHTTIVAAGGDGTVNEVVNGLADHPDGTACGRLGVLPMGTVNVFAKELDIPARFDEAWRVILAGLESRVDLPYAEYMKEGRVERRYFVQLAGAGIDSRALALVDWELKKKFGVFAYLWAGMKALKEPRPQISLATPERKITGPLIIIGNGRYYGGRFATFPRASMVDGKLDIAVGLRVTWPVILRGFWKLLWDRFEQCSDLVCLQASTFTLSAPGEFPFQLEGDNVANLPATFGLVPLGLRVVVPARSAGS